MARSHVVRAAERMAKKVIRGVVETVGEIAEQSKAATRAARRKRKAATHKAPARGKAAARAKSGRRKKTSATGRARPARRR